MQGAYRRDARALAACTYLKAGNVLAWRADGSRMAPAYYVALDPARRQIVWGVRGTKVCAAVLHT